jgi:hypothetical protein
LWGQISLRTYSAISMFACAPCVRVVVTVEKIEEERMVGGRLSR